jgi:hypothetical protein
MSHYFDLHKQSLNCIKENGTNERASSIFKRPLSTIINRDGNGSKMHRRLKTFHDINDDKKPTIPTRNMEVHTYSIKEAKAPVRPSSVKPKFKFDNKYGNFAFNQK